MALQLELRSSDMVVLGFSTAQVHREPQHVKQPTQLPRSLLSELLQAAEVALAETDELDELDDFSSDELTEAIECCDCMMVDAEADERGSEGESVGSAGSSDPINIPSSTYYKDELMRRQLCQLLHQRQLYKQHEEQQELQARQIKRQCRAHAPTCSACKTSNQASHQH